jgi:hypothetical protein
MGIFVDRSFPVLPGLLVEVGRRADAPTVTVRDSGTYLNIPHPATGLTFLQRIPAGGAQLDAYQVTDTRRTLILVGLLFCVPVFTAVIGLPMLLLGLMWPGIVARSGVPLSS